MENDKLRLTINGQVNDQSVVLHVYDSDLLTIEEKNLTEGFDAASLVGEVGIVQFIISGMNDHGIVPWPKKNSYNSSTSSPEVASSSGEWKCPIHPNEPTWPADYKNKENGKRKCSFKTPLTGSPNDVPDWGKAAESKKEGGWFIYCQKRSG